MLHYTPNNITKYIREPNRGATWMPFPGRWPTRIRATLTHANGGKPVFSYFGKPDPAIYDTIRRLYGTENILDFKEFDRKWWIRLGLNRFTTLGLSWYYNMFPQECINDGFPWDLWSLVVPIRTPLGSNYWIPQMWNHVPRDLTYRTLRRRLSMIANPNRTTWPRQVLDGVVEGVREVYASIDEEPPRFRDVGEPGPPPPGHHATFPIDPNIQRAFNTLLRRVPETRLEPVMAEDGQVQETTTANLFRYDPEPLEPWTEVPAPPQPITREFDRQTWRLLHDQVHYPILDNVDDYLQTEHQAGRLEHIAENAYFLTGPRHLILLYNHPYRVVHVPGHRDRPPTTATAVLSRTQYEVVLARALENMVLPATVIRPTQGRYLQRLRYPQYALQRLT